MPWTRTTNCSNISTPEDNQFCLCDDTGINLTPGTPGQTQTFNCLPCGGYGLQPQDFYCCNLSGTASE